MDTNPKESIAINIQENVDVEGVKELEESNKLESHYPSHKSISMDFAIQGKPNNNGGQFLQRNQSNIMNIGIEGFTAETTNELFSRDNDSLGECSLLNSENEFNHFYRNTDSKINALNFNDMYVRSNSPMASNCNSDVEIDIDEDYNPEQSSRFVRKILKNDAKSRTVKTRKFVSEDECEEDNKYFEKTYNQKYKKFTYQDIEKSLSKYYQKTDNNFNESDLLITYLSGMRAIYVISMNITQLKSYSVSMSTVSIAICLAVIAQFIKDVYWGAYLISSGNALVAILIFLSRYLKFDSNSAQYAFMAKQFNKLEMKVEFAKNIELKEVGIRGFIGETPMEFCRKNERVTSSHKSIDIEFAIMEMNEYIQELIPEEAVKLFPLLYRTNIIKFIRQIEQYRTNLIIQFRDIKNEIHYIIYKWNLIGEHIERIDSKYQAKTPQQEREKNRVLFLMDLKEKTKKELMQYNSIYIQINDLFKKEIRYAETHQSCFGCTRVLKPDYDFSKLNPIVRDYLKLVVPE
jgi:hypothetical protein